MVVEERKWPVLLGVGALVAVPLVILMLRPKPPPPGEPLGEEVSVEFVAL